MLLSGPFRWVCVLCLISLSGCIGEIGTQSELYRFWKEGNVGYMDETGQVVIPATFHQGNDFYEGQAVVVVDAREWAGQWAVIDREGNFLIEPSNDRPVRFHEGRWLMNRGGVHRYGGGTVWPGDEWFLADESGRPVGDGAMYEGLHSLQGGRAAVKVGEVWGYLDGDGQMVIAPRFRRGSYFHYGVAVMSTNDGVGAIDKQGHWAIEPTFDRMSSRSAEGLAFAVEGERWGVIDTEGNWIRVIELPLPDQLNGELARIEETTRSRWIKSSYNNLILL